MKSLIKGSYDNDPRGKNSYKKKSNKKKSRRMMDSNYLGQAGRRVTTFIKVT